MSKLEINIGKELHRVVYIEYNDDNTPHTVLTTSFISTADKPYWMLYWWDFFPNQGDIKDIKAFNSGFGGTPNKIQAPQWADGYIGRYWIADDAKFRNKPKNAKRLKNPIPVSGYFGNKSINPFKIAEVTNAMEYCEQCEYDSTEFCYEHKYDDKDGNVRYKNDHSLAE